MHFACISLIETFSVYLELIMPIALTKPELCGFGEVLLRRAVLQKTLVEAMAVDEQLDLRPAHRQDDVMPDVVRQPIRKRFDVDGAVAS